MTGRDLIKDLILDVEHLHTHILDIDSRTLNIDSRTVLIEQELTRLESRLLGEARFDVKFGTPRTKKRKMLNIELDNESEIEVTLTPGKSTTGQARKLDGPVNWVVKGTSAKVTVTDIVNGLTALIQSVDDAEGETTIELDADSRLGPSVVPLRETIVVNVSPAGADTLGAKAGDPRPKTNPVPSDGPPPPPPSEPVPTSARAR